MFDSRYAIVLLALMGVWMAGCPADKGESALQHFYGSECKDGDAAMEGILPVGLVTMSSSESYAGLNCIAWQYGAEETMKLDFLNFPGGCGVSWKGSASVDDGVVNLVAENASCDIAACGSCIYDWSFEVVDVPPGGDVALSLNAYSFPRSGCGDQMSNEGDHYTYTILGEALSKGIICKPASYDTLLWKGQTGKWNLPCRGAEEAVDEEVLYCDEGFDCMPSPGAADPDNEPICMLPCADDAECPLPELMGCTDGYCQLRETW